MTDSSSATVIVGGGFVGLFTALHLRHRRHSDPVILIDPQAAFVFKPMLFELLSAELPESVVCPSYGELLVNSQVEHWPETVTGVDLANQQVILALERRQHYDNLVLAVGSVQGYLGTEGAEHHAFAFRSREEAIALKSHLQACLRQSLETEDAAERQALLTVAIVGAGPAGVEMAATLADLLPSWYVPMGGNVHDLKLCLINHATTILAGDANANLKTVALAALNQRTIAVELRLGVGVKAVSERTLTYEEKGQSEPQTLSTYTTIWTAGTAVNPLIQQISEQLPPEHRDRHGQPVVNPSLQLLDFPNVFAAGDCVTVQDNPKPALAQIAYQQGAAIAHNLIAQQRNQPLITSDPQLRGTLMKLGLGNGVANLFDKVQIDGKVGDLLRNATYLELLPTPLHNFKATTQWLEEETIHRFHRPHALTPTDLEQAALTPEEKQQNIGIKAIAIIAPLLLLLLVYLGLKTPEAERRPFTPQPVPTANE
ncbi:MAG: NAD(P)/FAD-dependent oxidoreductase [Synechocystis sp.]|nr:NAD(P)/FAD-dependent oxidoreductase [Synechocystis sp.]